MLIKRGDTEAEITDIDEQSTSTRDAYIANDFLPTHSGYSDLEVG